MTYLTMKEMVAESGMSRFPIMAALQRGDLHGGQTVKGGTWRAEEGCFRAWMIGEKCQHRSEVAA